MTRARRELSPIQASLLGIALLLIGSYFVFTKQLPFQHHYTVRAVVRNSNLLVPGSPVRIAGADVGKVTTVGRYRKTDLAQVTMQIDNSGLPLHTDATLRIRPRLFLEGNFYVQLSPGTPGAPTLADGATLPPSQTTEPVQLDQVLDALPADTRTALQQALRGFGQALDTRPSAAEAAVLEPGLRTLTGAQAVNQALKTSPQALRDSAVVATALTGPSGRELSRTIAGLARATRGLAGADRQLTPLISEFDRTVRATAAQAPALRRTVALLATTAVRANSAFGALGAALGPTGRFAAALAVSIPQLPSTITAADPWLAQARPLLSSAELPGLLSQLVPASGDLARLAAKQRSFLPQIDAFDRCITKVFLPTGKIVVSDGQLGAGIPNYQEFWHAMVGQASEGQGADGNGNFLRIGATGGPYTIETGQTNYYGEEGTKFAQAGLPPLRTRPAYPNRVPPLRRAVPCYTQPVPNVNGPAATGPADGSRPNAAPPPLPNDPTGRIP